MPDWYLALMFLMVFALFVMAVINRDMEMALLVLFTSPLLLGLAFLGVAFLLMFAPFLIILAFMWLKENWWDVRKRRNKKMKESSF